MKRVKAPVKMRDGSFELVEGWAEKGLLVHKAPLVGSQRHRFWNISHMATGVFIDTYIDTQQQAREIAKALLEMPGVNWENLVPVSLDRAEDLMQRINDIRSQLGLPIWRWVPNGDDKTHNDLSVESASVQTSEGNGEHSGSGIDNE